MEEFNSKTGAAIEDLYGYDDPKEFLRTYLQYKDIEFKDVFKQANKKHEVYKEMFDKIRDKYVRILQQKLLKRINVEDGSVQQPKPACILDF